MFQKFTVFTGRAWRNVNRRISRQYVKLFARKVTAPFAMKRYGSDYGGWYAPDPLPAGALCYCIGVGADATFDFELKRLGGDVHSFDPTPYSIRYMEEHADKGVTFHPWGLWNENTTMKLFAPLSKEHHSHFLTDLHSTGSYEEVDCLTLGTIMERLGHKDIFLLKMDIEGSWYETLSEFIPKGIHPKILGVEFDSPAPVWRVAKTVSMLEKHGYSLAVQEKDNVTFIKS